MVVLEPVSVYSILIGSETMLGIPFFISMNIY